MSEAKYTKGPWKADGNLIGTVSKPNCIAIAYRTNANLTNSGILAQDEEMEANARLIAAAPELLSVLLMVQDIMKKSGLEEQFGEEEHGYIEKAISKALNQS